MHELEERRLTRYKAALARKGQCLRGLFTTGRIKSIEWAYRGSVRVRRWGDTGIAATRNGVQRGLAFLRRHPAALKAIAGLIVLAVALLALWKIPQWQVADPTLTVKERLELQDKARGTLAQILGGMVVLVGLYFTGRSAAAAWRNVQVAHEGQITERFTRAIEQLGSDKLAIRLGGIYALERIARDSAADYWPVMEVLTAYVRENAPWKDIPQPQAGIPPNLEEPTEPKPDAEIQAILTVLRRRCRWYGQGEDQPLDLRKTDLAGADLPKAHLEHAYLDGANFLGANLQGAHLERAHLRDADLSGADLLDADLLSADLRDACFWQANLLRADLRDAKLLSTNLRGAHLERADLRDAKLPGTDLRGANLSHAHLEHAFFFEAHLEDAVLRGTHLEGANLLGAHGMTREQLDSAIIDGETRLPAYLTTEEGEP